MCPSTSSTSACVHAGAGTDAGRCDRRRAADGAGRPVEAREQPAAPALDLAAAMAAELGAHDSSVGASATSA